MFGSWCLLSQADWERAKDVVTRDWILNDGHDAMYLPDFGAETDGKISIRELRLPLVECKESQMTPERQRVMLHLGLRRFPELPVLIKLASKGSAVQLLAFTYLLQNWERNHDDAWQKGQLTGKKIFPTENGELATVDDCFLAPNPFGRLTLHTDVDKAAAARVGVQIHPPLQECIEQVMANAAFSDRGDYVRQLNQTLCVFVMWCKRTPCLSLPTHVQLLTSLCVSMM